MHLLGLLVLGMLCHSAVLAQTSPVRALLRMPHFETVPGGDLPGNFVAEIRGLAFRFSAGGIEWEASEGVPQFIQLLQGNAHARPDPLRLLPGVVHHQQGRREQWRNALPTFERLAYHDVWPGIDVVYYFRDGELEFDFEVRPGADPSRIGLHSAAMTLSKNGELTIPGGRISIRRPVLFQKAVAGRRAVDGKWTVDDDGIARLRIGAYDPDLPLIIDPLVVVHTPDASTSQAGFTLDSEGNFLLLGKRGPNPELEKRKPDGSLIFKTIFGQPRPEDFLLTVAAGPGGSAFVLTRTVVGYPVTAGLSSAPNWPLMVVTKFDGSGRVVYAFGLPGPDNGAIAVDSAGSVFFGGSVRPALARIPATASGFQLTHGGGVANGILVRISPAGTEIAAASYFGGTTSDTVTAVAVDRSGRALFAGNTCSGAIQQRSSLPTTFRADCRPFVARMAASNLSLDYVAVLPAQAYASEVTLSLDPAGMPFVSFTAKLASFPTPPTVLFPLYADAPFSTVVQVLDGREYGFAATLGTSGPVLVSHRSTTEIVIAGSNLNTTEAPAGVTQFLPKGGAFLASVNTATRQVLQFTGAGGMGLSAIRSIQSDSKGSDWVLISGWGPYREGDAESWRHLSNGGAAVARFEMPSATPVNVEKVSGDRQTGVLMSVTQTPLMVRVTTSDSRPVAHAGVIFRPSHGGAPRFRFTDAEGFASAAILLHDGPGTLTVEAAVQGVPAQVFSISVRLSARLGEASNPRGETRVPSYRISTIAGTPERKEVIARTALGMAPRAIAAGANGWLYFVDANRPRVMAIDPQGMLRVVAGTGEVGVQGDGGPATAARFVAPGSLSVDSRGNLFVADSTGRGVSRIDATAKTISTVFPPREGPASVCNDASGNLFVLAASTSLIYRITPAGQQSRFANPPSFARPPSITCDGGGGVFIVLADGRLTRYKPDGTPEYWTAPSPSTGVATPPDSGNARQTPLPMSLLATAPDGSVLAASIGREPYDKPLSEIFRVHPDGRYTRVSVDPRFRAHRIDAVAADGGGFIYWADLNARKLMRLAPSGTAVPLIHNPTPGAVPALSEPLHEPRAVAVESDDSVLVTDTWGFRLRRIDTSGRISTVLGDSDNRWTSGLMDFQISITQDVSVSGSGDIALASPAGLYLLPKNAPPVPLVMSARGSIPGQFFTFGTIQSVAHGLAGRLHFWQSQNGIGSPRSIYESAVWELSLFPNLLTNPGAITLNMVAGMAADRFGNIYFSDSATHSVVRLDSQGVLTRVAGSGRPGRSAEGIQALGASLNSPGGLACDSQGNLFFAETGAHRIRILTRDGFLFTVAGKGAEGFSGDGGPALDAALNKPRGIAVGNNGDLYIADTGNNAVRRLSYSAPPPPRLGIENIASRQAGPAAPEQRAVVRGADLAATPAELPADSQLPLVLEGVSVSLRDSAGQERPAAMRAIAPDFLEFVTPGGMASGPGLLIYFTQDGGRYEGQVDIDSVFPGIYTANAGGVGVPLATIERASGEGLISKSIYDCSAGIGRCQPVRIEFGSGEDFLQLALLATGTRNGANVTAFAGDQELRVLERTSESAGTDRIVVELPATLATLGLLQVHITVDGKRSNAVDLLF